MNTYLCIDLKSFYASVECVERGLDPMTTNLVVADPDRSRGTLCLAVSPSLKKLGVKNRCRVYEIPAGIDYIMAPPRMQKYIDYAADIYSVYLQYIAPEDIHVYSIDETFLDVTPYLSRYGKTPKEMAFFLMDRISEEVGVRSTCGIGTNLYLSKIALDITAKSSPDFIGILDEASFCRTLWDHQPLTDFWRIAAGTARRLNALGLRTQRDIAQADPEILYKTFGIDAELLIDHAWGRESTTMADIHRYKPKSHCLSSMQVLLRDYQTDEAELILKEMADLLCLDMVSKEVISDSFDIYVGYSHSVRTGPKASSVPPSLSAYGLSAHGHVRLPSPSSADQVILPALSAEFRRIITPGLPVRRIGISALSLKEADFPYQESLFEQENAPKLQKTRRAQIAALSIKERYGKDAVLKAMNLDEAGTTRLRNHQIGGHKSGT